MHAFNTVILHGLFFVGHKKVAKNRLTVVAWIITSKLQHADIILWRGLEDLLSFLL